MGQTQGIAGNRLSQKTCWQKTQSHCVQPVDSGATGHNLQACHCVLPLNCFPPYEADVTQAVGPK